MGVGLGCLGMIFFAVILFNGLSSDSSSGFLWFCLIGIAACAFGGLYLDNKRKDDLAVNLVKKLKEVVGNNKDFNITQEFISPNLESYIALDENNKKVCIIENKHDNVAELSQTLSKYDYKSYVFAFKDILQSEILEDGATITKTSRGSQIGGALLGGVLAGGVGAVIGGLSGSSSSTTEVKKIQLQVIVNDRIKSFHRVTFMSAETLLPKDSVIYKNANNKITHWHNLISHLINRVDQDDKKEISLHKDTNEGRNPSTADELKKLAQLKNDGILTEEEFNQQKQKLLSS
ncbi:SHOCT domain-containing protein [Cytobacillus firmus]|uniref:SHOCT domain-containing protein n=1 Tax=Cytobacillus firmus TaxID=1399 RepID=UPI0036782252